MEGAHRHERKGREESAHRHVGQTYLKLKMRGANVALVVARASRRRKPKTLFEEDGLFSKWHPGGRCFGPRVVVTLQSR